MWIRLHGYEITRHHTWTYFFSKQGRKGTQSVFLKQDFNNMNGNKETGMIFWIVTECPRTLISDVIVWLLELPHIIVIISNLFTSNGIARMVNAKLNIIPKQISMAMIKYLLIFIGHSWQDLNFWKTSLLMSMYVLGYV